MNKRIKKKREKMEIKRFLNKCFKIGVKQIEIDYSTGDVTIFK